MIAMTSLCRMSSNSFSMKVYSVKVWYSTAKKEIIYLIENILQRIFYTFELSF